MAKPTTQAELLDYCKRQLGAPVLEINVADEQLEDLFDDALQFFQERHFDGVERTYLKYQITQDDIDRGQGRGASTLSGIVTTTETPSSAVGVTTQFSFEEDSNYLQIPESVIGIEKIFKFDSNSISGGMFSIKYQLFLNDLYYFSSVDLLGYSMTKSYLEDIDHLLTTDKQIRFNKRQGRLYLDIDWGEQTVGDYIVIDCHRAMDPTSYSRVYNDSFLKRYLTALIKKQWGQNLIKFRGTKLPGGIELNGRELYDDAQKDLDEIRQEMKASYEMPPLDFIG
tara:strand:- start:2134 stop:2979 length:846 start_codon:yes stop_codon:yes gene_type:complete